METIKQFQLELLNDTINHFNSNNRAVIVMFSEIKCVYSSTNNSVGCGIGKHLTEDLAAEMDNKHPSSIFDLFDEYYTEFPDIIKYSGKQFCHQIQLLHDNEENWDKNGLSEEGKERVEEIKLMFELN
jgi:hypothetical protein